MKKLLLSCFLACLPGSVRNRLGEHLGRPNLRSTLLRLKRYGFQPEYLVDGGANHGDWTRIIRSIWPQGAVLCVEPQSGPFSSLMELSKEPGGKIHLEQCLLGPKAKEGIPFEESGTGASVLASATAEAPLRDQYRLDTLAEKYFPRVDYLKLDLQGYELEALRGFEAGLAACQVVQLELSTLPLIPNAPLLHDVIAFMAERDFLLWEVEEIIRSPNDGACWQIDAIFLRKDLPIRRERKWGVG